MSSSYPLDILPQRNYRHYISVKHLMEKYVSLALVRRCDTDIKITGPSGKEEFNPKIFDKVIGLSVNLVGGLFDFTKHGQFSPKLEIVREDWNGKDLFPTPISEDAYSIKNGHAIYFKASDVHKHTFPFSKKIDKGEYQKLKNKASKTKEEFNLVVEGTIISEFGVKDNGMTEFYAYSLLKHHPTLLNFWHVQFDCFGFDSTVPVSCDDKSGPVKRLNRNFRNFLLNKIVLDSCDKYGINCKYYLKKPFILSLICDNIRDYWYNTFLK